MTSDLQNRFSPFFLAAVAILMASPTGEAQTIKPSLKPYCEKYQWADCGQGLTPDFVKSPVMKSAPPVASGSPVVPPSADVAASDIGQGIRLNPALTKTDCRQYTVSRDGKVAAALCGDNAAQRIEVYRARNEKWSLTQKLPPRSDMTLEQFQQFCSELMSQYSQSGTVPPSNACGTITFGGLSLNSSGSKLLLYGGFYSAQDPYYYERNSPKPYGDVATIYSIDQSGLFTPNQTIPVHPQFANKGTVWLFGGERIFVYSSHVDAGNIISYSPDAGGVYRVSRIGGRLVSNNATAFSAPWVSDVGYFVHHYGSGPANTDLNSLFYALNDDLTSIAAPMNISFPSKAGAFMPLRDGGALVMRGNDASFGDARGPITDGPCEAPRPIYLEQFSQDGQRVGSFTWSLGVGNPGGGEVQQGSFFGSSPPACPRSTYVRQLFGAAADPSGSTILAAIGDESSFTFSLFSKDGTLISASEPISYSTDRFLTFQFSFFRVLDPLATSPLLMTEGGSLVYFGGLYDGAPILRWK